MVCSCAAHHGAASTPPAPSPAPAESIPPGTPQAGANGYTRPDCSYCPAPQYSPEALHEKIQGQVVMDVVVGADGRVHEIVVKKSLGYGMDEQAIHALRDVWIFKPATGPDGQPATVHLLIEVNFHLY